MRIKTILFLCVSPKANCEPRQAWSVLVGLRHGRPPTEASEMIYPRRTEDQAQPACNLAILKPGHSTRYTNQRTMIHYLCTPDIDRTARIGSEEDFRTS